MTIKAGKSMVPVYNLFQKLRKLAFIFFALLSLSSLTMSLSACQHIQIAESPIPVTAD